MIDAVAIATDGSDSGRRAVAVGLDLAGRFGAAVHAVSVVDTDEVEAAPSAVREDLHDALAARAEEAVAAVEAAADRPVARHVLEGRPADEIAAFARAHDLDLVVAGTRGRHGEHRLLLGSVAERLVRTCPVPVLTVRQLDG